MKPCTSCRLAISDEDFAALPSLGTINVVSDLACCDCPKNGAAPLADHPLTCDGQAHVLVLKNCPACKSTLCERP
jgi:hypothetical protein